MDIETAKKNLDGAVHNFVKIIIKYSYDMAEYDETNIYIERMNDAKQQYYDICKN
jgi:hypothetical protein|tara:strand:- start:3241 stop:3405 length:165 start_codon:yes stop_codon:yes gene_type:complete